MLILFVPSNNVIFSENSKNAETILSPHVFDVRFRSVNTFGYRRVFLKSHTTRLSELAKRQLCSVKTGIMCSRYKTRWRRDCSHYAILSGEGGIVLSSMNLLFYSCCDVPLQMKCLLVLEFVIKKKFPTKYQFCSSAVYFYCCDAVVASQTPKIVQWGPGLKGNVSYPSIKPLNSALLKSAVDANKVVY